MMSHIKKSEVSISILEWFVQEKETDYGIASFLAKTEGIKDGLGRCSICKTKANIKNKPIYCFLLETNIQKPARYIQNRTINLL